MDEVGHKKHQIALLSGSNYILYQVNLFFNNIQTQYEIVRHDF